MAEEIRIRPEIQTLIDRGNVTADEIMELRCNSWEWEALIPAMNDQAFVARFEHALNNCLRSERRPFATYDESIKGMLAPELLRRFKALQAVADQRLNRLIDHDILPEGLRVISPLGRTMSGETVSAEKKTCGSTGPNNQTCDRERGHAGPCGVGRPSAPAELWAVRIWPDWNILDTFATEKEAREYREGSNYRVDGPYILGSTHETVIAELNQKLDRAIEVLASELERGTALVAGINECESDGGCRATKVLRQIQDSK